MEERLKLFLAMEGLSPSQFADKLGVQRSGVSHLLSGRNKPSFEFISKMMVAFPKINPDWLIMGTGKAYRDFPGAPSEKNQSVSPSVQDQTQDDDLPDVLLEENDANDSEPDLFSMPSAPQKAPEQAEITPEQAVMPAQQQPARPAVTQAPTPAQSPVTERVAAPVQPRIPAENRVKTQPTPVAGGKRIVQITILYNDGSYEVR